ncbi:MAG: protein translocase subunit SecD [Solirubrobacterales bacterium]|nr:protein translocase subunit SecD [Solirubrobacterales bacterium]
MGGRRRNIFVLAFVLALVIVSAVIVVKKETQLGLDLQGGIELTLQGRPTPQAPEVTTEAMDRSVDIIRSGCDRLGISEIEVSRLGADQISVGIPGATSVGKATECATKPARLYFYDWQNNLVGPAKDLQTDLGNADPAKVLKEQRQKWIDAGRPPTEGSNRSLLTQGAEPTIYDAVELASKQPRVDKCDSCAAPDQYYLFSTDKEHTYLSGPVNDKADLYFNEQGTPIAKENTEVKEVPQGTVVVTEQATDAGTGDNLEGPENAGYYVLTDNAALSGNDIKDPQQETDQSGLPNVTFSFTDKGRKAFQEVTRRIAQEGQARAIGPVDTDQASQLSGNFAIVLDGGVVSRPIINFVENPDGIDGRQGAQISGGFNIAGAQELAEFLQRGALPIDLTLTSQSQVSASLGQEALDQGVLALLIGLALVILFLITFYRFLGLVASLALIVYAIIFLAMIKVIPITMTLPGIAGLVLTIGVAADSNIVIFERIKEELRLGRSVTSSIAIGYRRGIGTIIDANVVTLLTAFILFVLATSGIKGFAFTLGVGTLVSLLTAVVFTQALLFSMSNTNFLRSGRGFSGIEGKQRWHFDFMGNAKWLFAISGVILLIGAMALTTKGLNFGIDFESGTRIEVALDKDVSPDELRSAVAGEGLADAEIQQVDNPVLCQNAFQIQSDTLDPNELAAVEKTLEDDFGISKDGFNSTSVGPTFGASVARSALLAVAFSLLLITGYVAIRFEPKYSVPILIAIMHDILIALGVYALIGAEVSSATVAAFLTILGYSLYDTIIVFDRIRENQPKMPRATFSQITNKSMSEVMTRSLATSLCTLLGVASLLVFGGETLRAFAIAILVGIASGTYSSIFIASPVLALWKEREPGFRRRRRQQIETQGSVPAFASDLEVSKVGDIMDEDGIEVDESGDSVPVSEHPSPRRKRGRK